MIFAAPLVQGGTPRLGTVIIELFFVALAFLAVASREGSSTPVRLEPVEISLYLLVLLAAFNLPRVPYYHDAERCFLLILMYAGTYSILVRLPGNRPLAPVIAALSWTAVFQAVLAIGEAFIKNRPQPQGTFDNPNFLAGFLAGAAGIFLARILGLAGAEDREEGAAPTKAWYEWPALAVILLALIMIRSRGGTLAVAVALGFLVVARFRFRALPPLAAAAAALLLVPNPLRERLLHSGSGDVYAYSRLSMWRSAARMFLDHPLLGVGLGQYQYFSPRYAFPVEGHWARYLKVTDNPHSELLMLPAELGLAGIAVLIVFVGAVTATFLRRRRRLGRGCTGTVWPLLVLAGLVAQGIVDFSLHSPPLVLMSLALLAHWSRPAPGESPPPPAAPGKLIRGLMAAVLLLYLVLAVRTPVAFYYFLRAGGPANLLDEKDSLARWRADGRPADPGNLGKAILWDGDNAPYHAAMGAYAVERYGSTTERRWLDRAFGEIANAIRLNPNNRVYHKHLADLELSLYKRGEMPEGLSRSMTSLKRALDLAPFNVFLREELARRFLVEGDLHEAERHFTRAAELEPCFLKAWFGLAETRRLSGRAPEAAAAYRDTLARAEECRRNLTATDYERGLVDLDDGLLHNRLESLAGGGVVP